MSYLQPPDDSGADADDPPYFRWLFDDLMELSDGSDPGPQLERWVEDGRLAVESFRYLARASAVHIDGNVEVANRNLWNLYALSRVVDLLLLPLQPPSNTPFHESLPLLRISREQLSSFMGAIGLLEFTREDFHPFYHEVVSAVSGRTYAASLAGRGVKHLWPAFMLEDMIICRAGVVTQVDDPSIDRSILESSPLYWSCWRRHRECYDLSKGWGSNSQWGTSFRRDLRLADGSFLFNADGQISLNDPHRDKTDEDDSFEGEYSALTDDEWIDVVRYRSQTKPPAQELSPFDYRYLERPSDGLSVGRVQ